MLVFGGSLGARSINLAAFEAFAGAAFRVLHVSGRRDYAELAGAARPMLDTTCASISIWRTSPTLWPPPIWWSPAPVARCSRSPRTGCPRSSCPTRTPPADHQSANARWMSEAGAAVVIPDRRADRGAAPRARSPRCSPTAPRLAAMASASRRPGAARRPPPRWPASCWTRPHEPALRRARSRPLGGASAALRGRRRGRDERLRARRQALGAEVSGSDAASSPYLERLRPTGCCAPASATLPRTCRRATGWRWSTPRPCRPRTPSAWLRASAACPSAPAPSCWPS